MAYELPLPKVVADVGPGGPMITGLLGANALTESNLNNHIKRIEAKYKPLTLQADAASKMAYSNLMGPQYLAKMMSNPDVVASLSEPQRRAILDYAYKTGMGQGTGNAMLGGNMVPQQSSMDQNPFVMLGRQLFGREQPQQGYNAGANPNIIPQNQNRMPQMPNTPSQGSGVLMQDNGSVPTLPPRQTDNPNIGFDQNGQPILKDQNNEGTYFEKAGKAAGIKEEGKESGKLRADDIQELNTTAFNGNTTQSTLDGLSQIVNSPEFSEIRQIPLAGQHEIGWYAQYGTPAQKRMIGKFLAEQGQVVVNAASQFKGAFRAGEQALINTMKVNPSDMPEVASGKIQGMSLMNKLLTARSALTAELMEDQNMSKGKAMKIADKNVDAEKIKDEIDNAVKIRIKNKKTGESKIISLSEARKLGVPNV